MKSESKLFAGSSLLLLCLAIGLNAQCMMDPSPPCQAFWQSEVVFSGVVMRSSYSATHQEDVHQGKDGEDLWNFRDRIAHFAVESVFRGKLGSQVDVIAK